MTAILTERPIHEVTYLYAEPDGAALHYHTQAKAGSTRIKCDPAVLDPRPIAKLFTAKHFEGLPMVFTTRADGVLTGIKVHWGTTGNTLADPRPEDGDGD